MHFTFVNISDVPTFLANGDGDLHWLHGYFISLFYQWCDACNWALQPKTDAEMDASDERETAPVDMTPGSMLKPFLMESWLQLLEYIYF